MKIISIFLWLFFIIFPLFLYANEEVSYCFYLKENIKKLQIEANNKELNRMQVIKNFAEKYNSNNAMVFYTIYAFKEYKIPEDDFEQSINNFISNLKDNNKNLIKFQQYTNKVEAFNRFLFYLKNNQNINNLLAEILNVKDKNKQQKYIHFINDDINELLVNIKIYFSRQGLKESVINNNVNSATLKLQNIKKQLFNLQKLYKNSCKLN